MTIFKLNENEQKAMDEKIRKLVSPPDSSKYASKKIPELSEDDRAKFHLTSPDEMELIRKMVEKSIKQSAEAPFMAKAADLSSINMLSPVDTDNRTKTAINLLGEMRKEYRTLALVMDICTKCGACVETCHTYLGTGDPNNAPVGRVNLMRKIYQRNFRIAGKTFGKIAGAEDLTEETIGQWYKYFYQCNECRRCAVYCPFGLDTSEITMIGRQIFTKLDIVPSFFTS